MKKVAAFVVLGVLIVAAKFYNRGNEDQQMLDEMKARIAQLGVPPRTSPT